jgi:hypothetical protein
MNFPPKQGDGARGLHSREALFITEETPTFVDQDCLVEALSKKE